MFAVSLSEGKKHFIEVRRKHLTQAFDTNVSDTDGKHAFRHLLKTTEKISILKCLFGRLYQFIFGGAFDWFIFKQIYKTNRDRCIYSSFICSLKKSHFFQNNISVSSTNLYNQRTLSNIRLFFSINYFLKFYFTGKQ